MSPSGTGVAQQFSEGVEVDMSPSGTSEVFTDCGCSQMGKCVGSRCGLNPGFLLAQKEKYEAAQKKKKAEELAARNALKQKQQEEDDELALWQYRNAPDKHVLLEWIENPPQRPRKTKRERKA